MTIILNHTIVASRDAVRSATFLSRILDLPPPVRLGHFVAVRVGETSLDFSETTGKIAQQHYAFLVSESEFDEIFEPIRGSETPSDATLRIAQAQLIGWLEGLFHGIQASLFSQQLAAQAQLAEMQQRRLNKPQTDESSGLYL